MLTAEYGGTGGKPIEGGMVVEEPDIEIGAGVSSKGMCFPGSDLLTIVPLFTNLRFLRVPRSYNSVQLTFCIFSCAQQSLAAWATNKEAGAAVVVETTTAPHLPASVTRILISHPASGNNNNQIMNQITTVRQ